MTAIAAFATQYDFSIIVTFYDHWQQVMRRTFYLRDLQGDSLENQLEHVTQIANEVAQEVHYMTGVGLDKIDIKTGRTKASQIVFNMQPHEKLKYFKDGVKFAFGIPRTYQWVKEGERPKFYIPEEAIGEGWHRELMAYTKRQSFNLPCMTGRVGANAQKEDSPFFLFAGNLRKRRKGRQKTVGWHASFNKNDPLFQRFLHRFYEKGNLCLGQDRTFADEIRSINMTSISYPPPKFKSTPVPRRSRLASQPTDDTEYVYFIQMGRKNIFKIGKSNDPQGRLMSLQTASPYILKLFHVFRADNASAAEESLHATLLDSRMEGEWFRLTNEQKEVLTTVTGFKENRFTVDDGRLTAEALLKGQTSEAG